VANVEAAEQESRPFAMGLTPINFDDTPAGTQRMSRLLREHADVVAIYLDFGVPWPEAFEGKPFHPAVQKEIAATKERISPEHKVFLALNAGAFNRTEMAGYWGAEWGMARPGRWANKSFDDPEIITAYTNYCRRMIAEFRPTYLAYAIEINMMASADPAAFKRFLVLAEQVYRRLKREHPQLMVFPTIQIDYYHANKQQSEETLRSLLLHSDAIAVSTYPYSRGFTPATLPPGWFSDVRDVDRNKRFLISETGFPAKPFSSKWFGQAVKVEATPQMQREYLERVLTDAHRLDAQLVNWFFPEDIAAYFRRGLKDAQKASGDGPPGDDEFLVQMGIESAQGLAELFSYVGLSDEHFRPRPAMEQWDSWRRLPRKGVKSR
jgi:hypothetical protein